MAKNKVVDAESAIEDMKNYQDNCECGCCN